MTSLSKLARGPRKRNPEYDAWRGMQRRCYDSRRDDFHLYGGRGVTVCDRWRESFAAFLADMGPRPGPGYSLDRYPNNNGNYEPGNCRWATIVQQNNNKRNQRPPRTFLTGPDGTVLSLIEWARRLGCPPHIIRRRIKKLGWSEDRAVTVPVKKCGGRANNAGAPSLSEVFTPAIEKMASEAFASGTPGARFQTFGAGSEVTLHGREVLVTDPRGPSLAAMVETAASNRIKDPD